MYLEVEIFKSRKYVLGHCTDEPSTLQIEWNNILASGFKLKPR